MAEKDILEKALLSYADVFADCENALVHKGKPWLLAEDLQPAPTESFYSNAEATGGTYLRNQFCDVSFYRIKNGVIKAQYMIGNETRLRRRQILRKASYQGGVYRGQLESGIPAYPVLGIVLDWTHKNSRIPLSLRELLVQDGAAQNELEQIDEVKLQVFHMKNLSKQTRKHFVSDMGFVVDFLNEGSFDSRKDQKIVHIRALCEMMQAITNDNRFTNAISSLIINQKEGREIKMCEYIDKLEAIGENRLAKLIQILLKEKKVEDIAAAASDSTKRQELYQTYGL